MGSPLTFFFEFFAKNHPNAISDRQTTSFIDNSIEAGILLGGNGAFTPWGSLSLSRARSLYDLV